MGGKTDYAKLRQRFLQRQQAQADQEGWWKPETGRHKIRIMPPHKNHDSWYVEYGVHYGITGDDNSFETITCPRLTIGKPCYACESVKGLWRSGTEADVKIAKKIGVRRRYASNVIVLSKDAKEVKRWSYGPQVWDQIAELCVGDESGVLPVDDPQGGYNLNLVVSTRQTAEGNFPQYTVKLDGVPPRPTPLTDRLVLEKLHDIVSLIQSKIRGYDEIKALLIGGTELAAKEETAPAVETSETVVEESASDAAPEGDDVVVDQTPAEAAAANPPPALMKATTGRPDLVAKAKSVLNKRV